MALSVLPPRERNGGMATKDTWAIVRRYDETRVPQDRSGCRRSGELRVRYRVRRREGVRVRELGQLTRSPPPRVRTARPAVVSGSSSTSAGSPTEGKVVDIYGDFESPMNSGGLCAKGAGSIQLVNNSRRIGAFTGAHPVNPVFAADGTSNGIAYKRTGNGPWAAMDLQAAMGEIATGSSQLAARSPTPPATTARASRSSVVRT